MPLPETPSACTASLQRAVDMFVAATPAVGAAISEWRSGFERLCAHFEVPSATCVKPVLAQGVPGLQVSAQGVDAGRLVIHFHSGGYVMGSSQGYRNFAYRMSEVTGAVVFVPDYRLAPEHPYPAAVEDGLTCYRWALEHSSSSRLIVSGDSAGGGLAIATLLAARDAGLPMPAGAVAISPLLDLCAEGDSMRSNASLDPLIDRRMVIEMGKVYTGDIDPHAHPLASPLWGRHHGLPSMLLMASSTEVLRDDIVRFAASVSAAGGGAETYLADGMVHIWTLFPFLEEATRSMEVIGRFAQERWVTG